MFHLFKINSVVIIFIKIHSICVISTDHNAKIIKSEAWITLSCLEWHNSFND